MQALLIILLCIFAAIVYGIIHDQITARVCIEYFTVGHPPVSAQWLLDNYDYAHARFLLHALPGDLTRGPYLVSSLQPLDKSTTGPYLVQNLSSVPPHLVSLWTFEFLNQAAQEHFWEPSTGRMLVLRLRTAIGIMAEGAPDVRKSLNEWITLAK